jgi:hypothetical protein
MAISPIIIAADGLQSGNNTASSVWFVSTPGVSTGDLVVWHVGWDNLTDTVSSNASTAPDGGAITQLVSSAVASQGAEVRGNVYYKVATTSWAATTVRFTPTATEQWTAVVSRVRQHYYDSSNPIATFSTYNLNATNSATVSSPSFTASTTDSSGLLVAWNVVDADPITSTPAGWQSTHQLDLGAVTHSHSYRNNLVASAESIPSYAWGIAADSSITVAYIIRANPNGAQLTGVSATVGRGTAKPTILKVNWAELETPDAAAGGGATLSGFADTLSSGLVTAAVAVSLAGVAAVTGVGSLAPEISQGLTGVSSQVSSGTQTAAVSVPLSGFSISSTTGTLSPAAAAAAELSGFALNTSIGSLQTSASVPVSGVQGLTSSGSLGTAAQTGLSGVSGTGSSGSFGLSASVPLSGSQLALSAGSLVTTGEIGLTGLSVTGSSGSLAVSVEKALSGQSITGSSGSLSVPILKVTWAEFEVPEAGATLTGVSASATTGILQAIGATLSGHSATGSSGSFGLSIDVPLSGSQASASIGTITPVSAAGATLTGVSSVGSSGSLSVAVSKALSGHSATVSNGTITRPILTVTWAEFEVPGSGATLTGVSASATAGSLQFIGATLSGHSATVSSGTLTPSVVTEHNPGYITRLGQFGVGLTTYGPFFVKTQSFDLQLSGQVSAVSSGSLGVKVDVSLGGQSGTLSQGSITSGQSISLTGSYLTASSGTLGVKADVSLSGVQGITGLGTLTTQTVNEAALTGQSSEVSSGSLGVAVEIPLTGHSAAGNTGIIIEDILGVEALIGVSATGSIGVLGAPTPEIVPSGIPVGGGVPSQGLYPTRTKKQISDERKKYGLKDRIAQVVEEVARKQAQALEIDKQRQEEELSRELKEKEIAWNKKYLDYLNAERSRLIREEISLRLQAKAESDLQKIIEEDELLLLILIAAASV